MKINFWAILKIVLVGAALVAGLVAPEAKGHVTLLGCVAAFLISIVIVYFWLVNIFTGEQYKYISGSGVNSAFYPMKKYPFNYWLICSIVLIVFGISCAFKTIIKMDDFGLYSISLPIGLGIFTACCFLRLSMKRMKNK